MTRALRQHVAGGLYHATLRGNHRQPIFRFPSDRDVLDDIVAGAVQQCDVRIHAYCWMTNHVHVVIEVSDMPLSIFMHRVATRYARAFQRRLATTGHLFERRYHAVLLRHDEQLLVAVRYVHLNPVRAGLVRDPIEYPWCGHRNYLGLSGPVWLCTSLVLGMVSVSPLRAREAYRDFVAAADANVGVESTPAAEALPQADDPVAKCVVARPPAAGVAQFAELDQLIARICGETNLTEAQLRGPSRSRYLSDVRTRIAVEATRSGIASLSDVARRLNRHLTSVSKALTRHQVRTNRG